MAAVLWVGFFSSYCYSDTTTYGVTNNAAAGGLSWNMDNVFPPEAGISVNGVFYRYTMNKDRNADAQVNIRNENAIDGGYIFNQTDDWSGQSGATINKLVPVPDIPRKYWGEGSITVDGDGQVTNPTVLYTYQADLCYNPLYSPSCPGYLMALYQWLLDNGLIGEEVDINDPYFDKYVQEALDRKTEQEEQEQQEEVVEEEEKEEESMEDKLAITGAAEKIADAAAQAAMLQSMANLPVFTSYYSSIIPGGSYSDTIVLKDKQLPDNRRAMRSLAQQQLHNDMVDSQYNR